MVNAEFASFTSKNTNLIKPSQINCSSSKPKNIEYILFWERRLKNYSKEKSSTKKIF